MFKRTEGVSTTDIVGKLLLLTKDNSSYGRKRTGSFEKPMLSSEYVKEVRRNIETEDAKKERQISQIPNSNFLATTRRIMHFSNNREKVVKSQIRNCSETPGPKGSTMHASMLAVKNST